MGRFTFLETETSATALWNSTTIRTSLDMQDAGRH
jgi:hypothetical protein